MSDNPYLKAIQESMTMEEIWDLENSIRALRRHLRLLKDDYQIMPDEPEAAETLRLIGAVDLSIRLMVERLGYDLQT